MAIFTKGLIGAGLAGTIALGTLVTWDGGSTIDLAKTKITEQAQQIGVFKTNETSLVNKVTSLKTEKAILKLEVDNLKVELAAEKAKNTTDNARIIELESQIAAKTAQITDLTAQIAKLNTDLENSAGDTAAITERLNALEAELGKANAKAVELKATLDNTTTVVSDQTAVDAALASTPGEVTPPDTELVYDVNVKMISGLPHTLNGDYFKLITFAVDNNGDVAVTNGHSFDITVDGVTISGGGGTKVLGTPDSLDGTIVTVTNNIGQSQLIYLTQD